MHVVDSVSRPIVDAHFQDALTNASDVAGIPAMRATAGIPEAVQPARKLVSLTHLDHEGVL
jgi:hypothetical protein